MPAAEEGFLFLLTIFLGVRFRSPAAAAAVVVVVFVDVIEGRAVVAAAGLAEKLGTVSFLDSSLEM